MKDKIKYSIAHHFGVNPERIYLTHPTFFSEITSRKPITVHDEYWHPHVDKVPKFYIIFITIVKHIEA